MVGPAAKRQGVAHLKAAMGLSERRACQILDADRMMIRYRSLRPPDTELRTRLRALADERKQFGYRRLFVLLRREGEASASTAFIGSIARKDCPSANARPAARRSNTSADPGRSQAECPLVNRFCA